MGHKQLTLDDAEQAAINDFCEQHISLAQRIARKWARWYPALDIDLESECTFALLKAARTRHAWPENQHSLVHLHCHAACMRLVVGEKKRPDSQLNCQQPSESGRDRHAIRRNPIEHAVDPSPGPELITELIDLLNQLTPAKRAQIVRRFLDGEQYAAIAADRDVSRQAVEQMISADFAKLRKLAGEVA